MFDVADNNDVLLPYINKILDIGSVVKVNHPITCLNPNEYFEITQIEIRFERFTTGKIRCRPWIRGSETAWFNADMILDIK